MRWKWRVGLVVIGVIEVPVLLWAWTVMHTSPAILAYAAGILATGLVATLAVRPILFGLLGAWVGGVAGGAWYFLRFVPPTAALALGAVLATLGCAIVRPVYSNTARILLRRFT